MGFYDDLADSYDAVTGAADRAEAAEAFADEFVRRFEAHSAVDAACGTGLYALALAERGLAVVGADISVGMLDRARRAAEDAGAAVQWVHASMQDLASQLDGKYDAVLCMGNSLPHLLDDADLDAAMAGFAALLAPGGTLALHLLNYARLVSEKERIVGVTRHGDTEYVRFYDFLPGRVRFNILEIEWEGQACQNQLSSTELRPWFLEDLAPALARHGLGDIAAFGDLVFTPFSAQQSDSLLILARR